jgi:DNA-binding NtrC family response regulator
MRILVVESKRELAELWQRHLERVGAEVRLAFDQEEAAREILLGPFDVIIMNAILENGSAFAIADLAGYRRPESRVIFVSGTQFFSNGSLFDICPNACALVQPSVPPEDLVALAQYHGQALET